MSDSLAIQTSQWERIQKDDFEKESSNFKDAVNQGNSKGYDFEKFSQDVFSSLYKFRDTPDFVENPPAWAKTTIETLYNLPEFKTLRAHTRVNSLTSGLASITFMDKLSKTLEEKDPNEDKEEDQGLSEDQTADMRCALRAACESAQEATKDAEAICRGFGQSAEDLSNTSTKEKLALLNRIQNNYKLKEIAEMAGRFKAEMEKVRTNKKNAGPDEVTSIETGSNLEKILASELAKMMNKKTKLLLFKDYLEGNLLQYRLEENIKESRGPIVFCIDCSGSMLGELDAWSKAIMLAIASLAGKENRPFKVIFFNSWIPREEEFPNGISQNALISLCETGCSGGTNFDAPLLRALELIQKEKNFEKADIVFITDGICSVDNTTKEKMQAAIAKGLKMITVLLGFETQATEIEEISTDMYFVSDLNKTNAVKDGLFSI